MRKRTTLATLTAATLLLAGCGGGAEAEPTPSTTNSPAPTAEVVTEAADMDVLLMLRWIPDDGVDPSDALARYTITVHDPDDSDGIVSVSSERGVTTPSRYGDGDMYHIDSATVPAGMKVSFIANPSGDLLGRGVLECTISPAAGGEALDRQVSASIGTATCESVPVP